ncbi:MAG: hypothetical protein AAGE85_12885 [Pseudomonadota bacterium]
MDDPQHNTFDAAFQQVLNALAAACLSLGKGYAEYDLASRSAFVAAVTTRQTGDSLSSGAIAFLTGLGEAQVSRTEPGNVAAAEAQPSPASQFIDLWRAEAADSEGYTNPLPLAGPLSVSALLERVPSAPTLEEAVAALETVGLAQVRDGIMILDDAALPGAAAVEKAKAMCAGAYPLLAAITADQYRDELLLESRTLASVRQNDVPRLHRIAESRLREAQEKVAELLTAYGQLIDEESGAEEDTVTVSSGIYFVAREQVSGA